MIDGVHPEALPVPDRGWPVSNTGVSAIVETPSESREVLWRGRSSVVQTLDVRRLVRIAEHDDARIHVCVVPGETIPDQGLVAVVLDGPNLADREVLRALRLGSERTFDQDPALALRLLVDIALRALSPAVNDPTTAVQTLDASADLLSVLVGRDLGVEVVDDADGTARVVLKLPTWEDYVSVASDEIVDMGVSSMQVRRRLGRLLEDLVALAPQQHVEALAGLIASSPMTAGSGL